VPVRVPAPLPDLPDIDTYVLLDADTAYLEVAELAGLQKVPMHLRNPMRTSSGAVGAAMKKCYESYHVRKFVIGSGGSCFSDGGLGAVQALGVFRFKDKDGH